MRPGARWTGARSRIPTPSRQRVVPAVEARRLGVGCARSPSEPFMPRFAPLVAAAAVLLASGTARGEGGGLAFEPGPPPFATVLAKARAEKKVVFVDFTTEWCGWCKKLEQDTFS